jgi:hypothetical protein
MPNLSDPWMEKIYKFYQFNLIKKSSDTVSLSGTTTAILPNILL